MKRMLKKLLKRLAWAILEKLGPALEFRFKDEAAAQKTLIQQYRLLASKGNEWLPRSLSDLDYCFRQGIQAR